MGQAHGRDPPPYAEGQPVSPYTDLDNLLQDIQAHVLREGVGKCQVVSDDDPFRLMIGYRVVGPNNASTLYGMRLTAFKESCRMKWAKLAHAEERVKIAESLTRGEMPTP